MSKILILSESGFGKTSAIGPISREVFEQAGIMDTEIKGLNPSETFYISATNKAMPIPGWRKMYTRVNAETGEGNYVVTNNGDEVAKIIDYVNSKRPEIKNIIIDDSNYLMQDYFMAKALTSGFEVFKKIGAFMGGIFNAMERVSAMNKNVIMMAHFEEYRNSNSDTLSFRYKTVGKMVQDYITPEGKFEIVLFGKQFFTEEGGRKRVSKKFVTNYDGQYPAKSPVGMFENLYIPNDLGYVIECVNKYEG